MPVPNIDKKLLWSMILGTEVSPILKVVKIIPRAFSGPSNAPKPMKMQGRLLSRIDSHQMSICNLIFGDEAMLILAEL